MLDYIVTICCVREKVYIIKLIRAATGWGLKDSKDYVEKHFYFGEFCAQHATFELTITADQYAAVMHCIVNAEGVFGATNRGEIIKSVRADAPTVDPFDLREA